MKTEQPFVAELVEIVYSEGVQQISAKMDAEFSQIWLERTLEDYLRQGLIPTLQVIEDARKGDEIADRVLRRVGAQMLDAGQGELDRNGALRSYCEEALVRNPITRGPGRAAWYENWRRDIGVACLVFFAVERLSGLDLKPTRRPNVPTSKPSAAFIVSKALERAGIKIGEGRVNNIWTGLKGELLKYALQRNMILSHPEALFPPKQASQIRSRQLPA
jgi:hypothetical protein